MALFVMAIIYVVGVQVFHVITAGIAFGVPLDDIVAVIGLTEFNVKWMFFKKYIMQHFCTEK